MINFLRIRWVYHTLAWLITILVILSNVLLSEERIDPKPEGIITLSVAILGIVLITYSHLFLIDKFFRKRQYFYYVLGLILIGLGFIAIFEIQNSYGVEITDPPIKTFISALLICAAGVGVRYFKRGIVNQYQLQELKAKNVEMELRGLRAQINPHFLFNNLNNIYSINQINSEKGSEMILELADVMRYHLSISKREVVQLSEEVELIKSSIELEKLRLNDNCELRFRFQDNISGFSIAPLILLPFIENAFKHGTHPVEKCFVHAELKLEDNQLQFTVDNSIIHNKRVVKTGIGLKNIKKRLQLIYPMKHDFKVSEDALSYHINLKITL